jgi:hypothetical protein
MDPITWMSAIDRPIHLCPVDLRKLHHSIGFDLGRRYLALLDFARSAGFVDEVDWLENGFELKVRIKEKSQYGNVP